MKEEKRVFVGRTLTGAGSVGGMSPGFGGAIENASIDAPEAVAAGSTWWLNLSKVPAPSAVSRGCA